MYGQNVDLQPSGGGGSYDSSDPPGYGPDMPCDDTSSDSAATYAEMISKLSEISQKYDVHSVIIGGDFNTSFMRKNQKTLKC